MPVLANGVLAQPGRNAGGAASRRARGPLPVLVAAPALAPKTAGRTENAQTHVCQRSRRLERPSTYREDVFAPNAVARGRRSCTGSEPLP